MSFADKLTLLRILLIPLFVYLAMSSRVYPDRITYAFLVLFFAVITDFFDGLVARLKNEKSPIGEIIDPLADKFLLLTAFICLSLLKRLPVGVVYIFVSRDIIILLGVAILYILRIEIKISPSIWGKLTTFFQMLTALLSLIDIFQGTLFFKVIYYIAGVFTIISGGDYFLRGVKALNVGNIKHSS